MMKKVILILLYIFVMSSCSDDMLETLKSNYEAKGGLGLSYGKGDIKLETQWLNLSKDSEVYEYAKYNKELIYSLKISGERANMFSYYKIREGKLFGILKINGKQVKENDIIKDKQLLISFISEDLSNSSSKKNTFFLDTYDKFGNRYSTNFIFDIVGGIEGSDTGNGEVSTSNLPPVADFDIDKRPYYAGIEFRIKDKSVDGDASIGGYIKKWQVIVKDTRQNNNIIINNTYLSRSELENETSGFIVRILNNSGDVYSVELIVTDNDNAQSTVTKTIQQ